MRAIRALLDVFRYCLGYFSKVTRLHRRLRGPSLRTYESMEYEPDDFGGKPFWVLELQHDSAKGWVPWAVLMFGSFRDHLPLCQHVAKTIAGVTDARVRRITVKTAMNLERQGVQVLRKHDEDGE